MILKKRCETKEAAALLELFRSLYVDEEKLPGRILLWNSLKDHVRRVCRPFSQVEALPFFQNRGEEPVLLYDEREKALYTARWREITDYIHSLESWEEAIDLLIFDRSLRWFAAITHEDLQTICAGEAIAGQ